MYTLDTSRKAISRSAIGGPPLCLTVDENGSGISIILTGPGEFWMVVPANNKFKLYPMKEI